jgi:hypothetical protein
VRLVHVPPLPVGALLTYERRQAATVADTSDGSATAVAGPRLGESGSGDGAGIDSARLPLRILHAYHTAEPFSTALIPTAHGLPSSSAPPYPPPLTRSALQQLLDELPRCALPPLLPPDCLRLLGVAEAVRGLYFSSASMESGGASGEAGAAALHGGCMTGPPAPAAQFLRAVKLRHLPRAQSAAGGGVAASAAAAAVPWVDCLWALQADGSEQEALYRAVAPADRPLHWSDVAALRLPLWLRSEALLRDATERVARCEYLRGGKDPFAAVLPYLALGASKLALLRGLFRLSPQHSRVSTLLARDFTAAAGTDGAAARAVASKNAFALISQHRYEAAAGFFLLAGRPGQAVKTALMQMRQPMLALLLARLAVYNAERGDVFPPPP